MERVLARLQGRNAALLVLGLGSVTLAVFMLGLIGFFSMGSSDSNVVAGPEVSEQASGEPGSSPDGAAGSPDAAAAPTDPNAPAGGPTATGGPSGPNTTSKTTKTGPGPSPGETPPAPGESPLPKGGNATGVTPNSIKYGVHIPLTFNRTPVALGGPVARGIEAYVEYLRQNGGINGRVIDLHIVDDEFTPEGAQKAADTLITDQKVFFLAGTLGVDQIKVVASEANDAKVPYFAGGGHEPLFKALNVHQILSSYDTHMLQLADYIQTDPVLKGKVIGIVSSDTPQIQPVVGVFDNALKKHGMSVKINRMVKKPEQQAAEGYERIIADFKNAGVQVVVPMTDPINMAAFIATCGYGNQDSCGWTYTFSNFAHDGETALTLFKDEWGVKKVRGLSGGCYPNAPDAMIGNTAKCGAMKVAKDQFNAVKGGPSEWTDQQADKYGTSKGYNSAPGYQWMFFKKAMVDQGAEVTRERFIAAINRYNGYSDLITGPITYKGSSNYAHGAEKMAVFEAMTGNLYKMISDGMVDGF